MRHLFLGTLLLLLIAGVSTTPALAQLYNVTFNVNTCTVPDTLNASSPVQVIGGSPQHYADSVLSSWSAGVQMTSVGGDYWQKTLGFHAGDTLHWKIRIGGGGWEENTSDFLSSGNHDFIVPAQDTVLPVCYWNNGHFAAGKNPPSYATPWAAVSDSFITIYFRVDMEGYAQQSSFIPPADTPGVRGGIRSVSGTDDNNTTPDFAWGTTHFLTAETAPTNSAGAFNVPPAWFYSGRVVIAKDSITNYPGRYNGLGYKFIINSDWGRSDANNRSMPLTVGLRDTTLHFSYFNDAYPSARVNADTVVVTYTVNMATAINSGGYTPGDTLLLYSGYFTTSKDGGATGKQALHLFSSLYRLTDTVITSRGKSLDYQYYHVVNGTQVRENYYNFYYNGVNSSEAEKRQVVVPASGPLAIWDTATSIVDARRQPDFPNGRTLLRNVTVKWEVDVRPAYYQLFAGDSLTAIQGTRTVHNPDSIKVWGVEINGPATGGWGAGNTGAWGVNIYTDSTRWLWDDGTHGDLVAGDSIWTREILYSPDSISVYSKGQVGQVYKFGIGGSDNEGGTGGYGNNHLDNIVDAASTYILQPQWGSINPAFYNAWDYDNRRPKPLGVNEGRTLPLVYKLEQNYPNPFNPSTKIEFSIPKQSNVTLKVYDILGQEVTTLVSENMKAGVHSVTFDALRLATGVYFYRLEAGNFVSTRKMILMK